VKAISPATGKTIRKHKTSREFRKQNSGLVKRQETSGMPQANRLMFIAVIPIKWANSELFLLRFGGHSDD
jgi:hypothetical protein